MECVLSMQVTTRLTSLDLISPNLHNPILIILFLLLQYHFRPSQSHLITNFEGKHDFNKLFSFVIKVQRHRFSEIIAPEDYLASCPPSPTPQIPSPPFFPLLTNGMATAQGGGGGKIVVNRSQIIGNVFPAKNGTQTFTERGN